jgi:hypothetical protein
VLCLLAKKVKDHKRKAAQIMNPSLDFLFYFLCSVTTKCIEVLMLIVEIQNTSIYDCVACHLGSGVILIIDLVGLRWLIRLCCYDFKLTMKNW